MKKSGLITGLTVILFFLVISFIMSYQSKSVAQEEERNRNEMKQQVGLMQSLYLINELKLTKEQAKELIPVIKEAKVIKDEMDSKRDGIEEQICNGIMGINDSLAKNTEPSDENFTKLRDLRKEMKSINEPFKEKAQGLVDRVNNILTDEQKNIINVYHPKPLFKDEEKNREESMEKGKENRHGNKMKKLQEILETARNVQDNEYKEKKDELLAKVSERMSKGSMSWSEIEAKITQVSQLLDKVRAMTKEEFEGQKENICNEFVSIAMGSKKQNTGRIIRLMLNPDLLPVLEKRI